MDLGIKDVGLWVAFVPEYHGNRGQPPERRVSCEIRLLRPLDQMAMASETDDDILRWRDERMASWMDGDDTGAQVRRLAVPFLRSIKLVADHTRAWRNVTLDGEPLEDPVAICLAAPIPTGDGPARERGLIEEVREAIEGTLGLSGEALKNYVCSFGGNATETSGDRTGSPDAQPAPADRAADPSTAGT